MCTEYDQEGIDVTQKNSSSVMTVPLSTVGSTLSEGGGSFISFTVRDSMCILTLIIRVMMPWEFSSLLILWELIHIFIS